jgi:argininosuccinate lyase
VPDINPRLNDESVFPDPAYKETVLRPLFDGAKTHHVDGFRRIDRAHLVMLVETGILDKTQAAQIAGALEAIDRDIDPAQLVYTGEVEDFFFLIEKELKTPHRGRRRGASAHRALAQRYRPYAVQARHQEAHRCADGQGAGPALYAHRRRRS